MQGAVDCRKFATYSEDVSEKERALLRHYRCHSNQMLKPVIVPLLLPHLSLHLPADEFSYQQPG